MVRAIERRSWYIFPTIGTILSFPVLLGIVAADLLIICEAITGQTQLLSSLQHSFPPFVFILLGCYAVFGPLLTCILCAGAQSTYNERQRNEARLQDQRELLWIRFVLLIAIMALGLVLLTGMAFGIVRQGT